MFLLIAQLFLSSSPLPPPTEREPPAAVRPAGGDLSSALAPSPRGPLLTSSGGTGAGTLWLPAGGLALATLAALAFARRRRSNPTGALRVVETASAGPRRALLLVEVRGQSLLIGSSEAGLALLASFDAAAAPTSAPPPGDFEALLEPATEDEALRRKLSVVLRGES